MQEVPEVKTIFHCKKNKYIAAINHGAKPILLFCKFENNTENPMALEAKENSLAYNNLDTLSVAQHILVLIR